MKINQEKINERLEGVPDKDRSFIYDAGIILEFLSATFMPTKYFLPDTYKAEPGTVINDEQYIAAAKKVIISTKDLYELYQLYREQKDYTRIIESRYTFTVIIKHLRYYKNGWEFKVFRVSRAQIWHAGPLLLRTDLPKEVVNKYMPEKSATALQSTVEANPVADPNEVTEEDLDKSIDALIGSSFVEVLFTPQEWVEVQEKNNWMEVNGVPVIQVNPDRFKEVNYTARIDVEPRPLY